MRVDLLLFLIPRPLCFCDVFACVSVLNSKREHIAFGCVRVGIYCHLLRIWWMFFTYQLFQLYVTAMKLVTIQDAILFHLPICFCRFNNFALQVFDLFSFLNNLTAKIFIFKFRFIVQFKWIWFFYMFIQRKLLLKLLFAYQTHSILCIYTTEIAYTLRRILFKYILSQNKTTFLISINSNVLKLNWRHFHCFDVINSVGRRIRLLLVVPYEVVDVINLNPEAYWQH